MPGAMRRGGFRRSADPFTNGGLPPSVTALITLQVGGVGINGTQRGIRGRIRLNNLQKGCKVKPRRVESHVVPPVSLTGAKLAAKAAAISEQEQVCELTAR
jgi:hypothetical protein